MATLKVENTKMSTKKGKRWTINKRICRAVHDKSHGIFKAWNSAVGCLITHKERWVQISIEQGQQESEHSEIISIQFRKPSGIVFCCCCCFRCGVLFFSVHGGVHRGRQTRFLLRWRKCVVLFKRWWKPAKTWSPNLVIWSGKNASCSSTK